VAPPPPPAAAAVAVPPGPAVPVAPPQEPPLAPAAPRQLDELAGMVLLTGAAIVAAITPPYSWRDEFVEQFVVILRRVLLPAIISSAAFAFGVALSFGGLMDALGSSARLGGFWAVGALREFGPWVTGMVVAGVGGTAVCADLGARRVRDEISALEVMGLDPVRALVVPRFLALGIVTALMNLIVCAAGMIGAWLAAVIVFHDSSGGFFMTFATVLSLVELLASVLKTAMFGFIIAIVCCYKGLNASGGSEGVGRAVNQAVVVSFAAIWVFHYLFTSTMLAAFPDIHQLR